MAKYVKKAAGIDRTGMPDVRQKLRLEGGTAVEFLVILRSAVAKTEYYSGVINIAEESRRNKALLEERPCLRMIAEELDISWVNGTIKS